MSTNNSSGSSEKFTKQELLNKLSALLEEYEKANHDQDGGCILGVVISFPEDSIHADRSCTCDSCWRYSWGGSSFIDCTSKM